MIELSTPQGGGNGRVALVTGAARGIGLGIAAWLISEGWQVVLTDLDRERGSRVAKVLGESAWFITMDVADEVQVAQGVAEVLGQFGRLDALVCNAAVADPHNITLESLDLAYWNRVMAVNLGGPMLLAKHCAPYLRAHGGAIVNLASTRARQSEPDSEAYAASKGGAAGLDSCPGDQPGAGDSGQCGKPRLDRCPGSCGASRRAIIRCRSCPASGRQGRDGGRCGLHGGLAAVPQFGLCHRPGIRGGRWHDQENDLSGIRVVASLWPQAQEERLWLLVRSFCLLLFLKKTSSLLLT